MYLWGLVCIRLLLVLLFVWGGCNDLVWGVLAVMCGSGMERGSGMAMRRRKR